MSSENKQKIPRYYMNDIRSVGSQYNPKTGRNEPVKNTLNALKGGNNNGTYRK